MSEAKVLTEKEKRATLSNAKKKKKAPLRNVYAHPRNDHWLVLTADDDKILADLIKGLFPSLNASKNANCKDEPKSTVSKRKRNSSSSLEEDPSVKQETKNIRSQIVVGLREVIVAIERDELECLVLAKEVDPPFLRNIVGNLAASSNVPFVSLSNFRELLLECLGFKSWCVGFKKISKGYFAPICEKVMSIIDSSQISNCSAESQLNSKCSPENTSKAPLKPKPFSLAKVHLYRTDKSKRIFVPDSASVEDENTSTSFIPFSKDDDDHEMDVQSDHGLSCTKPKSSANPPKKLQQQRYFEKVKLLPLKVKRFQGNPNKAKWRKDFQKSSKEIKSRSGNHQKKLKVGENRSS